MEPTQDIFIFFGRFHSLMVHLPIGFISLAILLQLIKRWRKFEHLGAFIPFVWLLSAVASILSVLLGYSLSLGGGYNEDTLYWHRFGGFSLIGISFICYLLSTYPIHFLKKIQQPVYFFFVLVAVFSLTVTGHLGGTLTHGNNYLSEFAPKSVFNLSEASGQTSLEKKRISSLDSADIFNDAVMPIIQSKCVSCHNTDKKKGGLLLTSYDAMFTGGKTREGIAPGNLIGSEIFRRISLPADHKEFMPTNGKTPLTENQLAILEWWIESGAQKKAIIADLHPNKKMQSILSDFFQFDRDELMELVIAPPKSGAIEKLLKQGFQVNQLTLAKNIYEVKFQGDRPAQLKMEDLNLLKDQIVWLQLTNCTVTDEELKIIGNLPNLHKLNLNRNSITDTGISYLQSLPKLQYLNLYGTAITNKSIPILMQIPELKKLYVWETAIDTLMMDTLKISKKNLEVVYKLAAN